MSESLNEKLTVTVKVDLSEDTKKLLKKTASHAKRQSIVEKAKSIAFDSCDKRIQDSCDEVVIELANKNLTTNESEKLCKSLHIKPIKKVQHLKGGKYQTCQVVGKYGKDIELPDEYEVLIIETQKENN